MVFCTYCGHSFTRDEHLERHILTHTNVKPFKCFTCHMSFARRDLLQRHYTVHGRDQNQEIIPAANGMIPKSAGRTPIACSNCAKTKTKCDKKFPCSRCAGRNLRCTLRPTRRSSKNANRMGLITAETIASGVANGILPPDQTVAAEAAPMPVGSPKSAEKHMHQKPSSPGSGVPTTIPEEKIMNDTSAQYFEQPMSNGHTSPAQQVSPLATPDSGFIQGHMPTYEDFMNGTKEDDANPRFMLDWGQMPMPMGFDHMARADLMLDPSMGFDPTQLSLMPPTENTLTIIPEMANAGAPLITPIETPKVERSFAEMDLGNSNNMFYAHARHMSTASMISNDGHDIRAVIAAQDGWNVFRCTPTIPSNSCPTTAKINLECLEQTLKNHEGWSTWTPTWDEADFAGGENLSVMQLHESTRDKLLAITQTFLHKALETHKEGQQGGQSPMSNGGSNFVLLPPARVLEYFLRSYANGFERYYSLTSRGILDANELMHCYNDKASCLLVLMMIAQGSMNISSTEARWLAGGLTEACRISLFDLIERNITMAGDPIALHSALLFTSQAAWSGDKWQMDIAMGQRSMYFHMLRHSGVLDGRSFSSPHIDHQGNADSLWTEWIQHESRSRLVYSWVMIDQDLALFHDTAPLFSVTEFGAPMPDSDRLWQAKSAPEWSQIFEQVHEFSGGYSSLGSGARPMSLHDLFRHFLDDEMASLGIGMTPLQMRLLLHPLQSMVCHYGQLMSCFSDSLSSRNKTRTVTASSTRCRLEEVQSLLQRWYDMADRYLKVNPICAVMQANLVMFHLISLNAVTNFSEIERLARREGFDGTYQQLVWTHKRCIADVEEAVFHCGQVLRIIRSMPRGVRPPWWAGAIYRAALVLWTDSLINKETPAANASGGFPSPGPTFAIDALPVDHPMVVRFLSKRVGQPALSKRDGTHIPMDHGVTVLAHCIEIMDEGTSNRFVDGVRNKLDRLMRS
ncbi:transcription factor Cmr1, partial [Aureobasidium melanogenum]